MSDPNFDWGSLGDEWRAQPSVGIDVDRLRAEVRKRGRNLRRALLGEVALTLASLATLAWLMLKTDTSDPMMLVFALLVPTSIGFQLWSLWLRRRQLRDDGLDAAAMLELEIGRVNTGLRYWRHGTWYGVLLLLGVYALALSGLDGAKPMHASGMIGGAIGGGLGVLVSAVTSWYKHRGARSRLAYLRELQAQLNDGEV